MKQLSERLHRLGLHEAAQIVDRYEAQAAELHAARQKIIELQKTVDRLERERTERVSAERTEPQPAA